MQTQTAGIDRSTEFQCPVCGSLAFEVLGVEWYADSDGETEELGHLGIRCLRCLHAFEHPLHTADCDAEYVES